MKKTRTETREVEVHVCDLCERELGGGNWPCFVCGREACYACLKGEQFAPKNAWVELFFLVCKDCLEVGEDCQESIRQALSRCSVELDKEIELWKRWAKERDAK